MSDAESKTTVSACMSHLFTVDLFLTDEYVISFRKSRESNKNDVGHCYFTLVSHRPTSKNMTSPLALEMTNRIDPEYTAIHSLVSRMSCRPDASDRDGIQPCLQHE